MTQMNHRVCLRDIHGDGSPVEDDCVCQKGELASKNAISPLDDSIAIMTRPGVIKLAHRPARDMAWTVEVVADGKCFDTTGKMSFSASGQLLATARVDGGIEIWDPMKGKHLRTIVCDCLSMLEFSNLLADCRAKLDATKLLSYEKHESVFKLTATKVLSFQARHRRH
jgi:WD40 repeat protein